MAMPISADEKFAIASEPHHRISTETLNAVAGIGLIAFEALALYFKTEAFFIGSLAGILIGCVSGHQNILVDRDVAISTLCCSAVGSAAAIYFQCLPWIISAVLGCFAGDMLTNIVRKIAD